MLYNIGDFGAKPTSRVKRTEFSNDYLPSHAYSRKTNPVTMDFRVIYLSFRNFSITYQFFKKSYRGFFEIYRENQQKRGLKIACIFALKFSDFEGRYLENKLGTVSISFHFRM